MKNNKLKLYRIQIAIASVITSIYILYMCTDDRYSRLWLIPLCYGVLQLFFARGIKYNTSYFGFKSINCIMFIKYMITPLMIVIGNDYTGIGPEPSAASINMAINITIYEIFTIVLVTCILVCIFNRVFFKSKKVQNLKENINDNINVDNRNIIDDNNIVLSILLICTFLIYIITNKYDNSISIIMGNLYRSITIILTFNIMNMKYRKKNSKIYIIFSMGIFLLTLFEYTGKGRWDTIIMGIIGIVLLAEIFPKSKKIIKNTIVPIMIFIVVGVTIFKFIDTEKVTLEIVNQMIRDVTKHFQVYFSGPRNIALSLEMIDSSGIKFQFMDIIKDFIGSMPIVSGLVDQSSRYNYLFNYHIFNGYNISQIIPMSGISYSVFGFWGSSILIAFFESIVLYIDKNISKFNRISYKYLGMYCILFTSMCIGFNIQIITNKYYAFFIPLAILLLINNKITIRNNKIIYIRKIRSLD